MNTNSVSENASVIVLATRNAGKVRELAGVMQAFGLHVIGLDAFPDLPEVEETGSSFAENALIKARAAALGTGLTAAADDSGLEVDALNGAPGVRSARYADDRPDLPASDRDGRNNLKLLEALADVPEGRRTARFCCALAVCTPKGASLESFGAWEGRILAAPRGTNGFGYDPLFLDPETGLSAAELTPEDKMRRSHRARALKRLAAQWPAFRSRL